MPKVTFADKTQVDPYDVDPTTINAQDITELKTVINQIDDTKVDKVDVTALAGTAWDLDAQNGQIKELTLSGNTEITTTGTPAKSRGLLIVTNPASHTLVINGTPVTVKDSGKCAITVIYLTNSIYYASDAATGGTGSTTGGTTVDADAQAWATASGITDTTYIGHVSTFVKALKTAGIYSTHFDFIHILCGGDAAKTKLNLINPTDTDAAYRLTYPNGATFGATGVTTNGTNQYIKPHWVGGSSTIGATDTNYHIAAYERTAAAMAGSLWGVVQTGSSTNIYMYPYMNGNVYVSAPHINQLSQAATTGKGFFLQQNSGSGANSVKLYRDSTLVFDADNNGNAGTLGTIQDLVFNGTNSNAVYNEWRASELSIISAGKAFTPTQAAAYQNAVAQLATNLGL